MKNALANLWKMIVNALTLGAFKGNKFVSSLKSPIDEVDECIQTLEDSRINLRNVFYELTKDRFTHTERITSQEEELKALKVNIEKELENGNESRAKQLARSAMHKESSINLSKRRVKELENRCDRIREKVDIIKTDIDILKDKRTDLKTAMAMRDDSKTHATGFDGSDVSELLNEIEDRINGVQNEDKSWQHTEETFKESSSVVDNDVDEYLNSLRK